MTYKKSKYTLKYLKKIHDKFWNGRNQFEEDAQAEIDKKFPNEFPYAAENYWCHPSDREKINEKIQKILKKHYKKYQGVYNRYYYLSKHAGYTYGRHKEEKYNDASGEPFCISWIDFNPEKHNLYRPKALRLPLTERKDGDNISIAFKIIRSEAEPFLKKNFGYGCFVWRECGFTFNTKDKEKMVILKELQNMAKKGLINNIEVQDND